METLIEFHKEDGQDESWICSINTSEFSFIPKIGESVLLRNKEWEDSEFLVKDVIYDYIINHAPKITIIVKSK
jgi:hypothetical protein